MSSLVYRERLPAGPPEGLLVLHHGRGADERDLLGLAETLDPDHRLHAVAPRAPLQIPGWPGFHWYLVPRVGYPEPESFQASMRKLADFHDETWERTGIGPERSVLAGFSMGSVMSYATGLSGERPPVAGILAFSGFIPTVEGFTPEPARRTGTQVFIAHGRRDRVIGVDFARRARSLLEAGGATVSYHESDAAHHIDPVHVREARGWLAHTVSRRGPQ